ncbi:tectonic-2 isoform X2 [Pristis pectinata]|uniref:tectonic-2 isoform X2 n=1 Tax=Pristis pectinata TaxID=685728 RepID=UPI00223DB478|nr:tectonic-2 isoform X2 [Pristis pectinata]
MAGRHPLGWAFPLLWSGLTGGGGVEFQPSFLIASVPEVSVFLVGENSSTFKLGVETVAATDDLLQSNCVETNTTDHWVLTTSVDEFDLLNVNVQLTLDRPLVLCGNLSSETSCCLEPLCILETLRVTACLNGKVSATLLVQVIIYVNSTFQGVINENNMLIPKQKYHPLGPCPCNLTAKACDVGCCCDEECTPDMIQLFGSHCFTGVFGGNVSQPFDQLCSVQTVDRSPDWFPFLCVQSSLDNSPYLGLFFEGNTVGVSQDLSFAMATSAAINIPVAYRQGDPIVGGEGELFTIPQKSLNGQCLRNAPVAYLKDFDAHCVTPLTAEACADTIGVGEPIQNGQGTLILPVVTYQNAADLGSFIPTASSASGFLFPKQQNVTTSLGLVDISEPKVVKGICENMILQADYVFYWNGTMISNITLLVTVGNISLDSSATVTQRFSVTFINSVSEHHSQVTRSGNPGYLTGKPVLAALASSKTLQRAPLRTWRPVGNGLCSSAETTSVLFGEDSTSGCLLRLSIDDFENCTALGLTVYENLLNLVPANYVARRGNSNLTDLSEWVPLFKASFNGSFEDEFYGFCAEVPAAMNMQFLTAIVGAVEGVPQQVILGASLKFYTVNWQMSCGGGNTAACRNSSLHQSFSISTSVQFIQMPAQPEPMLSSLQINYTEYDCARNDVCWPDLAYPLTRRYTGETYSQSIAQGMLLVFIFLVTALLGSPWNKILKVWNDATF